MSKPFFQACLRLMMYQFKSSFPPLKVLAPFLTTSLFSFGPIVCLVIVFPFEVSRSHRFPVSDELSVRIAFHCIVFGRMKIFRIGSLSNARLAASHVFVM